MSLFRSGRLMASMTALATLATAAPLPAAGKAAPPAAQVGGMRVGAARVDITPTDLSGLNPMSGKTFDKVHDPIFARLVVIEVGPQRAALVSIDAIEVGNMDAYRQQIATATGIPADHLMITATHDHNAPRLGDVTPGALAHPGGPEVTAYTDAVIAKVIGGLRTAAAAARPAHYGLGDGTVDVNVNRDEFTGKGWRIGFNPEGPSDKALHLVRFDDADGRPIAVILNYPVHANVMLGANQLSGDLTGVATRYVENALGGGAVALYAQSAIGDQAPRIFLGGPKDSDAAITASWQATEAQGVMIGAEAVRVLGGIHPTQTARFLASGEQVLRCQLKQGTDLMADMKQAAVSDIPIHLSMIRFDDVALVGVSGEVVTEIYWHLRRVSPLRSTLLVSLTNDRVGYLPDDAAYDRPIFEVKGSPVQRGCAEDGIVDGLTGLIAKLDH